MAEFGWSDDPLNYAEVLKRHGSRRNLDRSADAGDMDALLWRSYPAVMDRAAKARERDRAASGRLSTIATAMEPSDTAKTAESQQAAQTQVDEKPAHLDTLGA